jgi:hypothetical protein
MQPIFEFHRGYTNLISGEAKHWIGLLPHAGGYGNGGLTVGRKFKSLAQFEVVAEEIRADLDRVMQEARRALGG